MFHETVRGYKNWEFRKNDRNFEQGDLLRLLQLESTNAIYAPTDEPRYTHKSILLLVMLVVRGPKFGIPEGYCVMSTKEVKI